MKKKVTNNGGVTAIYVRRSVADRDNNSLSIESQKEDCIRYVGEDCVYRLYCDNGFSGKDTEHRPAFQQMMSAAREGLISRIVVKKYDRFSRNLRDYLNVSEELDKLGVTVYSLSEPFNTETKEGRMMRNNLLNFAEFERETIAGRVADSYNTRSRETGFFQGRMMSFGYTTQRMTVNGKDAYDGVHGVFLHNNADGGKFAKIGYHEGLVDSSVWLTVQDKKQHSRSFHTNRKANNSWLVGLLKCKECGLAVVINVQQKKPEKVYKYLFDSGMQTVSGCVSRNYSVKLDDVEEIIYSAMCERMKSLEIYHK